MTMHNGSEAMEPIDADESDARLRAVIHSAPFPPTPRLEPALRQRVRRRLWARRGGYVAVAFATAVVTAIWQWPEQSRDGRSSIVRRPPPLPERLALGELQVLFAQPPIDLLDQLAHQQAAFVEVIDQIVEE
jgi:hypothetical protein